ncbi:galactokinase [Gordonia sp. PKS22-38]|uniref:Galactokinase n=1 Tax=Gordonia prachuapensis TaxID=3115651 RepID=A0ABU7MSP6_9ACTN|nr:galactokinase [Gordonia sp. PKS22-38]
MTAGSEVIADWLEPIAEQQLADEVTLLFADRFGKDPDGVWFAPGRVNLIGEHIDYVGGRVLPFALPHGTVVAVRLRDDDVVRCISSATTRAWTGKVGEVGPGDPRGWAAYPAGVLWAIAYHETLAHVPGMDIAVHSSVPRGSGLSSSAALECALALAVAELLGAPTDDHGRSRLARDCVAAENIVVGAQTGGMDQSAALRARTGHALHLDCTDFTAEQIPLDFTAAGLELLVINTNAPHRLADGEYGRRRASVERISRRIGPRLLRDEPDVEAILHALGANQPAAVPRMRHVLTEIRRVDAVVTKLRAGAVADIGEELIRSGESLRTDYEVSCPELDNAVAGALDAGALGARMTGGGFGGSAIALIPAGTSDAVSQAITRSARAQGLPAPQFLAGAPSQAAHRLY